MQDEAFLLPQLADKASKKQDQVLRPLISLN